MTFTLTPKEIKKINTFMSKQDKLTGQVYGTIGGGYTYHFTPTSLGVITQVENNVTNAILDLTNYNEW